MSVRRVVRGGWPILVIWFALFGVWLVGAWLLFPGSRPLTVLIGALLLLFVAAACVQRSPRLADPAQHDLSGVAGEPSTPAALHGPTAVQREIVDRLTNAECTRMLAEFEGEFPEDDAARRTQLTEDES